MYEQTKTKHLKYAFIAFSNLYNMFDVYNLLVTISVPTYDLSFINLNTFLYLINYHFHLSSSTRVL